MAASSGSALLLRADPHHWTRPRLDPRPSEGWASLSGRHLSAQGGEDILQMITNGEVKNGEGAKQHRGEEERGGNLSHSFIPLFVHRNGRQPIWFPKLLSKMYVHVLF
jgi:hypothetical protein